MQEEIQNKNKSISREIIRFIITGVIATLVDLGISSLIAIFLPDTIGIWEEVTCTTCGFLISLIVNWILSTYWVYKNVGDSVNTKSSKNIALFVLFSIIGLGLGLGLMAGFGALDDYVIHADFINWAAFLTDKEKTFTFMPLFWFCLFFGIKTLVVMFWNYISRKKWIYKSPETISKNNQK